MLRKVTVPIDLVNNSQVLDIRKYPPEQVFIGYKYARKKLDGTIESWHRPWGIPKLTHAHGELLQVDGPDRRPRAVCGRGVNVGTREFVKGDGASSHADAVVYFAIVFRRSDVAVVPHGMSCRRRTRVYDGRIRLTRGRLLGPIAL